MRIGVFDPWMKVEESWRFDFKRCYNLVLFECEVKCICVSFGFGLEKMDLECVSLIGLVMGFENYFEGKLVLINLG